MQYADDTTFFLDGSECTIKESLRILSQLSETSDLTNNLSKSTIFPLGPYNNNVPCFISDFNITITKGPVQMLGVFFTNDGNDLFRLNYQPKLSRLKNTLRLWSSRDLTPIGRNTIVKTCALSQLVFLFLDLPNPPKSFLKELENIIFDFIWSGNPDKVRRLVMINATHNGGLFR